MKLIYYADDDLDDLKFFQEAAEGSGFIVVVFFTGQALLDTLNASPKKPDIIFMDVRMPIAEGDQILKEIKRSSAYRKIPVVIISGPLHQNQVERYLSDGANYIMTKKSSMALFKIKLHEVLGKDWENYRPKLSDFKDLG